MIRRVPLRVSAVAVLLVAVLGAAAAYVIRYEPTRHACSAMSADADSYQLNDMEPTVDTSSVVRAASRLNRHALRATDVDVRTAGVALATALADLERAARTPFAFKMRAQQAREDAALGRVQDAWVGMRVACGLPTVDPED